MAKKKKPTKKVKVEVKKEMTESETIKINILEMKIKSEKIALDRYIETIVRSCFIEVCTSGAYFNKMYRDSLQTGFEMFDKSKKSEKEKYKLKTKWFPLFIGVQTKIEILEENLKYYKGLTGWAKKHLNDLSHKKKKKIVMDCLSQETLWSGQFNRTSILYDKLNPIKKKSKEKKK